MPDDKSQIQNSCFEYLDFGHCNLFGICNFGFGA